MSMLRILSREGDTVLEWTKDDAKSIAAVKREFDSLIASGYQAFKVDSPTEGEVIRNFDPEAETVIMTVPMVGG